MSLRETFGLTAEPPPKLSAEDRAILQERRRQFWSQAMAVAVGVFIALVAFALVIYVLFRTWLESL